ncbi:4Fe-4S binding protein [Methanolobus psychrotolerans]|uniref:4Fe-4S binding protein n=1 Tax=Methanolobus psychrotolerans TaxID=1874706 RepID=UPI000B915458|nr:4Fe-4S binding protein [Methanolobus psychrotolerans]
MVAIINRELCTGCGQCVETCPVEAISLDNEDIAIVDSELCVDCGQCVDVCPVEAISLD